VARGGLDQRAEDENGEDVMLSLVCAVADFAHESISTVLAWPWPLFCAMGCRMIRRQHDERAKREAEDEQREMDAEEADVKRQHAQMTGRAM
jgi:hypothetical protein